jgi:hypothetical protein
MSMETKRGYVDPEGSSCSWLPPQRQRVALVASAGRMLLGNLLPETPLRNSLQNSDANLNGRGAIGAIPGVAGERVAALQVFRGVRSFPGAHLSTER